MLYWVGKKKHDLKDAQCEDSLTSSVFERLSLLSDENLWWVLRNACDKQSLAENPLPDSACDKQKVEPLSKNVGKLEKVELWPRWKADSQLERNNSYVEPDVFLRFEKLDIIVEAKRQDFTQSQNKAQWENELGAWFQEFKGGRPVLLLAIGGNTIVGSRNDIKLEHLPKFSDFRIEQLHWEMLRDAVFELSNRFSNDTQLIRLCDQLDAVFNFFGVRSLKMRWLCNLRSMSVGNVKPSQLSSALADVRKAYRVLVPFQDMIKNILLYIKEQYRFDELDKKNIDVYLYPFGAFADRVINEIGSEKIEVSFNDKTYYQNIYLYQNINFTGYTSVWFGGPAKFNHNQVAELWGFVVPDDRFIMNRLHGIDDILNVQDAENASGYIVLFAAINNNYIVEESYNVGDYVDDMLWLADDDKYEGLEKIRELLSSPSDEKIMSKDDDMSILKRYRLEEFADKQSTDRVLRDFAKLVLEEGKVKIFKDRFYSEN